MQLVRLFAVGLLLCLAPLSAHGQTKQQQQSARSCKPKVLG
jgi:hypothetical protein